MQYSIHNQEREVKVQQLSYCVFLIIWRDIHEHSSNS